MFNLPSELYTIDSGSVTINYSSITRTEVENATSLSYNGNVFCSITNQDLSGNGTFAQPYVVHSTKGFLYLTNKSLSGLALNAKYINLACDVVLNDETFDKDGNPKGGDGVVYSWNTVKNCQGLSLNGEGHYIKGLYINTEEKVVCSLFGEEYKPLQNIENLKMSMVYISSIYRSAPICYAVYSIKNCVAESGFVFAGGYAGGIAVMSNYATNCINYIDISVAGADGFGGIVAKNYSEDACQISNCFNYGDLIANNSEEGYPVRCGGIIGRNFGKAIIERCKNFGNIITDDQQMGGIVGFAWNADIIIENCDNYGDIDAAFNIGGILGGTYLDASCYISGCNNYGAVKAANWSVGSIFGTTAYSPGTTVTVISCNDFSLTNNQALVGGISECTAIIEKCFAQFGGTTGGTESVEAIVLKSLGTNANVYIKNIEAKIVGNINGFYIIRRVTNQNAVNSSISNVYIKGEQSYARNSVIVYNDTFVGEYQGIVVDMANRKEIYGSDFSGFYIDYKTGKLGFKEWDGKGFFQSKVTEEWFVNNGYRKKEA